MTPTKNINNPKPKGYTRIHSDSPNPRHVSLTIGDVPINFSEATITLRADEFVTIQITTRLDSLDLVALERDTEVVITRDEP